MFCFSMLYIIDLHLPFLTWYQSAMTEVISTPPSWYTSSPISISDDSNLLVINPANQINSIKLSDDNFLLWHIQVLAGIRGLGLDLFILDNLLVPPKVLTDDKGTEILNPKFIYWCRQDQLLFSFLLASMTEGVQAQMIGCVSHRLSYGLESRVWLLPVQKKRLCNITTSNSQERQSMYEGLFGQDEKSY